MRPVFALALLLAACGAPRTTAPPPPPSRGGNGGGGGDSGSGGASGQGGGGGDDGRIREPANCAEGSDRICTRIVPDPNDPDAFTLAYDRDNPSEDTLYVALPDLSEVAKVDTYGGSKVWQVPGSGDRPGALAQPSDGSVWVANQANLVHLDRDGNVVCRAAVAGVAPALAIDGNGDVWAGTDDARILRFAANTTDGTDDDGYPRCASLSPAWGTATLPQPVGSLGIDDRGVLWTANGTDASLRIDTTIGTWDEVDHRGPTSHVAVDGWSGQAYFDGFALHRIAADGPYLDPSSFEVDGLAGPDSLMLSQHEELLASYGTVLYQLDLDTLQPMSSFILPGTALGLASALGKFWAGQADGSVARVDPRATTTQLELTSYSRTVVDTLATGVARSAAGSWMQVVETDVPVSWLELSWTELRPSGTTIRAGALFGATRDEVTGLGPACSTSTGSPLDLTACPGSAASRFAAFSFYLHGGRNGTKPTVGDIRLISHP